MSRIKLLQHYLPLPLDRGDGKAPHHPPTQEEWIPLLRQVSANGEKDYNKPVNPKGAKLYQEARQCPKNIITKTI